VGLVVGVDWWSSQSEGVRVDAELHHSSTDLAVGTVSGSYSRSSGKDRTSTRTSTKLYLSHYLLR